MTADNRPLRRITLEVVLPEWLTDEQYEEVLEAVHWPLGKFYDDWAESVDKHGDAWVALNVYTDDVVWSYKADGWMPVDQNGTPIDAVDVDQWVTEVRRRLTDKRGSEVVADGQVGALASKSAGDSQSYHDAPAPRDSEGGDQ